MSISLALKKPAKKAVQLLEKILPKKVFSVFLKILFPVYRFLIRNLYMLNGVLFYALFNKEKLKMTKAIYRILPYTMVGLGGLEATYKLCKSTLESKVEGDFVELGVARGGCAAMIGNVLFGGKKYEKDRNLLLFDSYEGLPPPTKEDYTTGKNSTTGDHVQPLVQGSCLGTLSEVKNLLLNINKLPGESIKFIQGWFQDTVPAYSGKIDKIALLRMDGDWYESTMVCMEWLYDSVSEGGAVIIDDYYSCFGCKKAIDEYLQKNNIKVELFSDGRGGSYFIKPARKIMAEQEERKLKEIEHSKLRREILQGYERIADTHAAQQADDLEFLIKDKEAFKHYFANMKYYSVTLSSDKYLEEWLKKKCDKNTKVLDFACGSGENGILAAQCDADVIGIDISPEGIDNSNENAKKAGVNSHCMFEVMDGENMAFPDNTFDLGVEYGALHHVDLDRAVSELRRVIKPHGEMICVEALRHNPFIHWYRKRTPHLRTEWEVEHILGVESIGTLKKYFNKVEIRFFHLAVLSAVPFRKTSLFKPLLSMLNFIDSIILSNKYIGKYAWIMIIIMSEPRK